MAAIPALNSHAGLKKLDDYLLTRSYLTWYKASKDDLNIFGCLSNPPSSQYVNLSRWYNHIVALLSTFGVFDELSGVIVKRSPRVTERVLTTDSKDVDSNEEDVDLFGEKTEEEKKAAEERAVSVKVSTKKKKSGKSSVLIDIKPLDDETDMKKQEEAVRFIQMEGLGEHQSLFRLVTGSRSCRSCAPLLTTLFLLTP